MLPALLGWIVPSVDGAIACVFVPAVGVSPPTTPSLGGELGLGARVGVSTTELNGLRVSGANAAGGGVVRSNSWQVPRITTCDVVDVIYSDVQEPPYDSKVASFFVCTVVAASWEHTYCRNHRSKVLATFDLKEILYRLGVWQLVIDEKPLRKTLVPHAFQHNRGRPSPFITIVYVRISISLLTHSQYQ